MAYLLGIRLLAVAAGFLTTSRQLAAGCLTLLLAPLLLAAGWTAHPQGLSAWTGWLRYISAPAWIYQKLAWDELIPVRSFRCDRNPIIPQDNTIIVQVDCGVLNGRQALGFLSLREPAEPLAPLIAAAATALVGVIIAVLAAVCCRQRQKKSRGKLSKHS